MSNSKFKDVCCNPFKEEHHTGLYQKRNLRRVSSSLQKKLKDLNHDDVLCASCRKRGNKIPDNDPREYLNESKFDSHKIFCNQCYIITHFILRRGGSFTQ